MHINTPAQQGYFFPAEWAKHKATWLSWPHKEASWPGKLDSVFPQYAQFIKLIAEGEEVRINVANAAMETFAKGYIEKAGANMQNIFFHHFPTNDAWCRDHGPAFLVNPSADIKKVIVDWGYNAWGGKYPPFDLDDVIPTKIAEMYGIPVFNPGIVMEGGSVEFNGRGTLLTSTSCLLNPNRNPSKSREQIEEYLEEYYGIEHILWLGEGIVGDDTDGHIDDITRFVNEDTVVTVVEQNKNDDNYFLLKDNLKELLKMRLENGKQLNVIELPMPSPVIYDDQRLPASYANFYISNNHVIVPTFKDKNDDYALETIQQFFPDRKVTGLDSTDIIWGLGSFHCLSQQEPA